MKKLICIFTISVLAFTKISANSKFYATEYETAVTFPAAYAIGDYIEFIKVNQDNKEVLMEFAELLVGRQH